MADPLSYLTDADFAAVQSGDLTKLSDAGLKIMQGEKSHVGGFIQGAREVIDAPAQLLERGVRAVAPKVADWISGVGGSAEEHNRTSRVDIANQWGGAPSAGGQFAGNVAGSIVPGMGAARAAATVLPRSVAAAAARNPYTAAAVTGAAAGPLTQTVEPGEDFWTEKGKQAGFGAVGGVAGRGLVQGAGRALQGVRPSREAQLLLDEGVPLTPGQVLGGGWQRLENAGTSTPFLGSAIARSYDRGTEGLNRALYRRALDPIGQGARADTVEVGRAGVREVRDTLGRAYDDVLSRTTFQADQPFVQNVARVQQMMGALPADLQKVFNDTLDNTIGLSLTQHGRASGESIKAVQSELRRVARMYRSSDNGPQRSLADALDEVGSQIRQALARTNPREAQQLQALDRGWAEYTRVRNAAGRLGSAQGVITPGQYAGAVRHGDHTVDHGGYAGGQALGADLSDAAKKVLMSKVPDSGTGGRVFTGLGMMGMLDPFSVALPLAASAAYAPGVQRRIVDTMINPPQVLRRTGRALQGDDWLGPLIGGELAAQ